MLNFEQAKALVEEYLLQASKASGYDLVIASDSTREEDFGWVFFYNSREFLETGDWNEALGGNGPLIVDAASGKLNRAGSARSVEHYVAIFRRDGDLSRALDE